MSKKLLLAGVVAGVMAFSAIPVMAATHNINAASIQQVSQSTKDKQPPKMKNGEQPPEPPKDANGKPLPPPDGKQLQGHDKANHNGEQPPEPPKDKDGKPLPPPDGVQHGQQNNK